MNIEQSNKLIAGFMGVTPSRTKFTKNWYDGHELDKAGLPFHCGAMGNGTDEPKFHTSWDWLMPVVEKIASEFHQIEIGSNEETQYCRIKAYSQNELDLEIEHEGSDMMKHTYDAVIEFINWYNDKK